jgi:prepilin-type N-terminal cleavage/methylation domain-containing protein
MPRRTAFTLIEVLVSMAILVLLVTLVLQIVNGATKTTSSSRQHLEADAEARAVFDRMASDFGRMVNRKDVDFLISNSNGSDALYFFSEAPAVSPTGTTSPQQSVSLVGYRINNDYQLERLGQGLTWNDVPPKGPLFLTYADAAPPVPTPTPIEKGEPITASTLTGSAFNAVITGASGGAASPFHVLGNGVFRLEFLFLLKPYVDNTGTPQPAVYSSIPYNAMHKANAWTTTANNGLGWSDVQAIVVTLALMDNRSRQMTLDAGTGFASLAGNFPQAAAGTVSSSDIPATVWQSKLPDVARTKPSAATSQIRIYQRTFVLNSN